MFETDFFKKSFSCFLFILLVFISGCASHSSTTNPAATTYQDLSRINREQAATIQSLNREIQRLNQEINQGTTSHYQDLTQTKAQLENHLQRELQSGNLGISVEDKGLVVTVLDRILFDPGSPYLKPEALITLDKVAAALNEEAADHIVYVEGHTDNLPIHSSRWPSNWELSTARATEVIHYFVSQKGIRPERLAATGYGEFHPVVSNATPEGRMKNRRVEIVISPKKIEA